MTHLCSHCGWHPDNSPRWCGSGCGSDFNRMIPTERADALNAAGEKVRELERWRMDAQSRAFKAEDRVRDLEAERQHILDCINLYGDETLHRALDAAGLLKPNVEADEDGDCTCHEPGCSFCASGGKAA